jgi:hypothetical protein
MTTRDISLSETGAFSNLDGMSEELQDIELAEVPEGFLVVPVGDRELLLPRQFAALLLRYREAAACQLVCIFCVSLPLQC